MKEIYYFDVFNLKSMQRVHYICNAFHQTYESVHGFGSEHVNISPQDTICRLPAAICKIDEIIVKSLIVTYREAITEKHSKVSIRSY